MQLSLHSYSSVLELYQEIIIGQRQSLPGMPLGYLNFKKVIFRNYAVHAETVSGKLVNFRETRFRDSVRESEAESTNEKMVA